MAVTVTNSVNSASRQEALAGLGEIASRMAHEIRNPLNAIRMQVAVIRNKLSRPDAENLSVAKSQLERLELEVLRVEKLAKAFLEYGRPPIDEPEPVSMAEVMEDVAALVRPEFEEAGHTLRLEFNPNAHGLQVFVDKARLRQVFMNLLSNSMQALCRPGWVCLQVGRYPGDRVYARVEDSGCGIPEDAMPHIFEPFYSRSGEGEGLGLAIVRKIVENAGGLICVESRPGEGTCFEVVLPMYSAV